MLRGVKAFSATLGWVIKKLTKNVQKNGLKYSKRRVFNYGEGGGVGKLNKK